jgi:proton-translocating NADH-quinone oxidoreductase chain L
MVNIFLTSIFFLILVIPILNLIILPFISFEFSKNKLIFINFISIFFSFFFSFLLLIFFFFNESLNFEIFIFNWINIANITIEIGFLCDRLVILMLFVVSFISCLVHLYSIEYMRSDPNQIKFLQYLTLFTVAMYILITANNFIQMFIGWEGVGICSYLLINFWDTRIQANTSAMKAIIVNRIGDTFLIIAFVLLYTQYNSFNYNIIFSLIYYDKICMITLLFIFLGAVGKSAQLFLHVWLPDAMEGPTPVSALIHAATMVTAGIFIIIRCGVLFDLSPFIKKIILIIGGITALFAGSTGILQNDLKKIIAYSTCSQLGFMCVSCGLGLYDIALFHLAMHAFFKALLFLSAGSIIHAFSTEEQDIRRMGGLIFFMPVTYLSILIGSLALMGFPFTAGFYSKDLILENLLTSNCPITFFSLICCLLATICTIIYSTRLIYLVFFTKSNINKTILLNLKESSFYILIPLIILIFFSIFGGFLFKSFFIKSNNWFIEELSILLKLLPFFLILSISFFTFCFLIYFDKFKWILNNALIKKIHRFLIKKWYFDIIYMFLSRKFLNFCFNYLFFYGDRGFLEIITSTGLVRFFKKILIKISFFENNNILGYLSFFFSFIFILIIIFSIFLLF